MYQIRIQSFKKEKQQNLCKRELEKTYTCTVVLTNKYKQQSMPSANDIKQENAKTNDNMVKTTITSELNLARRKTSNNTLKTTIYL